MSTSQTLFQKLYDKIVNQGSKFKVSLEKKTISIDGKIAFKMSDGKPIINKKNSTKRCTPAFEWTTHSKAEYLGVKDAVTTQDALAVINEYYQYYKHSRPSERSDNKADHSYFKALPEEKLSSDDMLYGLSREEAQFILEYHVLMYSVLGLLKWDEELMRGKWFYQSPEDKDLVILRSWVE